MQRYNPKDIEPRWQKIWEDSGIYQATEDPSKPKKYILEYFPYPSGAAMHVGHVRNYTIGDVLARFNRMAGYNVLHPMGWDGFGLPAENYAIKTGISPREAIDQNTARFKEQLMQMGFSYDWTREIDSTDPKYYKWTQWFFLKLWERGLAYQQESLQWWCPFDKTVLANEQVENGRCWRCGNEVEKKALKQWFFKITDYADRLARDLDDVDWSDSIKSMQRNWIGRSTGAEIDFQIDSHDEKLTVFTTRPDTLYGVTFMVLSPEHPLVEKITTAEHTQKVNTYLKATQQKSDIERQETNREKTGVFTGAYAINPINDEKIPIWIADYVLMGYGTGAIMAVPAHDERDFAFAEKFNLPVRPVVAEAFGEYREGVPLRPSVIILAHDPKQDKYCILEWLPRPEVHGKNGLELPGGGIEDGETIEQAALREFAEETGYTDVKFEKILPVMFALDFAYLFEGKTKYKRALKSVALLTVNSLQKSTVDTKESYEQDASVVWLTKDELLQPGKLLLDKAVLKASFDHEAFHGEGIMVNSGPYDGLPSDIARERIVANFSKKGAEPTFVATSGESAIKPGEEFIKREAVVAIVKNPKTGAYLCTSWKTHSMNGLVTGGVEAGEDPVEAAKREIHEETGYKNVRLIADPGIYINSLFYHRQKQQNRWAHFHFIFFELENDERDPVDEQESALLDAVWKDKSELTDFFSVVEGKYIVGLLDDPATASQNPDIMSGSVSHDELVSSGVPAPIIAELGRTGAGRERVNYKMRDWLISRQRYWGAPIPMIHCEKCGVVPVSESDLPVVLPELKDFEPSGDGRSPLAKDKEWVNVNCPKCGGPAQRETDTMDGFACSSWYFLRFADPHNDKKPFDKDKVDFWLPVDDYIGGAEHAVMHLLYARMWTKVMHDAGLIDFDEPFTKLRNHGMILAPDGQKMSKSKGNTIEPGVLIDQGYGADAIRIMELFIGPWNQAANWSVEGMGGAYRFLQRVWTLVQEYNAAEKGNQDSTELLKAINRVIKKVGGDIETMSFNTAIASLMELTNELFRLKAADNYQAAAWGDALSKLIQILAPFAPHIAEELWHLLGHEESVHTTAWPAFDDKYLMEDTMTIVVQVNGKLRGEVQVVPDASEESVIAAARLDERVAAYLNGKEIRQQIYVPGRVVNFVV